MGILFGIIIWISLCMAVANAAQNKFDKDYTTWFFISAICSPLLGVVFLFLNGDSGKKCPECAETVKLSAKVCKHCGHKLEDEHRKRLELVDKMLAESAETKKEAK